MKLHRIKALQKIAVGISLSITRRQLPIMAKQANVSIKRLPKVIPLSWSENTFSPENNKRKAKNKKTTTTFPSSGFPL
jgi:hypothetical protein